MNLTQEMKEMIEVVKIYADKFREHGKYYINPDVSDKILKKLLKHFDPNININSIIAFYDTSLLGASKEGIVFTADGMYTKILMDKYYINYKDIEKITIEGKNELYIHLGDNNKKRVYTNALDPYVVKFTLNRLKEIDKTFGQTTFKTSGKVKPIEIPEDKLKICHGIIHGASVAAGGVGAGLAQAAGADNVVLLPIQVGMIIGLGEVFELNITESGAKGLLGNYGASLAGRAVSQYLVGWIPGLGNAINATTAAGITEVIGWMAVKDFHARWIADKNKGKLDGMKQGYVQASAAYEHKFREQAEDFFKQTKIYKEQKDEYEKLLKDYESYIKDLEGKVVASEILAEYERLKSMQVE